MSRIFTVFGVIALSGCAAVPLDQPGGAAAANPWSIDTARIVFMGRRNGVADLCVLDRADGSVTPITTMAAEGAGANAPVLSDDGTRLAFQVRRGRDYEIHVMDAAGGPSRNLTNHPEYDVLPAWSPDGARIAFMSTRGFELGGPAGPFPGHVYEIGVAADAAPTPRQVTLEPLTSSYGPSDWSPDGRSLLIARDNGRRADVYEVDVETGVERRLADGPAGEYAARYSSDGRRIAYHAETDEGSQIMVMDIVTGVRRAVTLVEGFYYYPVWSPDDRWLLVTSCDEAGVCDLHAARVDGGEIIDLVVTAEDEREGAWLPYRPPPAPEASPPAPETAPPAPEAEPPQEEPSPAA